MRYFDKKLHNIDNKFNGKPITKSLVLTQEIIAQTYKAQYMPLQRTYKRSNMAQESPNH